jgi:DNA invertase Pin-like site-specific DNA recombinase
MLHIYSALAEEERRTISLRTSEALQAAKARGVKLGRQEIADANRDAAAARDAELEPTLRELSGLSSRAAAAEIERRGLGKISYITVIRARARLGLAVGSTLWFWPGSHREGKILNWKHAYSGITPCKSAALKKPTPVISRLPPLDCRV